MMKFKKKNLVILVLVIAVGLIGWGFPHFFEKKLPVGERDEVKHGMQISSMVIALLNKGKELNGYYPQNIDEVIKILSPSSQEDIKALHPQYQLNSDGSAFTFSFTTNEGGKANCLYESSSHTWYYKEIAD